MFLRGLFSTIHLVELKLLVEYMPSEGTSITLPLSEAYILFSQDTTSLPVDFFVYMQRRFLLWLNRRCDGRQGFPVLRAAILVLDEGSLPELFAKNCLHTAMSNIPKKTDRMSSTWIMHISFMFKSGFNWVSICFQEVNHLTDCAFYILLKPLPVQPLLALSISQR